MSYSKEQFLEILRQPKLFKKKKGEIIAWFKEDTASTEAKQQKTQIAIFLAMACTEILSGEEENPISKMSSSLIIKDVMDLGLPHMLLAVSSHLLPIMKTIVIKCKDEDPMGKNYFSKKPTAEQEQIGTNIVSRIAECLFTWACWHYRNSNGTKTRFFLALEGSMRAGVEFPEEEKFVNFTREELFKYQGRSGYQAVLYIEDLVNMTDQISQTIVFLKDQFQNGQNTIDEATLGECLKLYEDYSNEAQQKDKSHFFPEDKAVYDIESKFVEEILPKVKKYTTKELPFKKFSQSVVKVIETYETSKKSMPIPTKPISSNPSIQIISPPLSGQQGNLDIAESGNAKQMGIGNTKEVSNQSVKFSNTDVIVNDQASKKNKKLVEEDIDNSASNSKQQQQLEREREQLEREKTEIQQKFNELQSKQAELTTKYNEISGKNSELTSKNSELIVKLNDTNEKYSEINGKFQEIQRTQSDYVKEQSQIRKDNEIEMKRLQEEMKKKDKKVQELEREQENYERRLEESRQREESKGKEEKIKSNQLAEGQIKQLQDRLQAVSEEKTEFGRRCKELELLRDQLVQDNESLKKVERERNQLREEVQTSKEKYQKEVQQLKREINDLNQSKLAETAVLSKGQGELNGQQEMLKEKVKLLGDQLDSQRRQFEEKLLKAGNQLQEMNDQMNQGSQKYGKQQEVIEKYQEENEKLKKLCQVLRDSVEEGMKEEEKLKQEMTKIQLENENIKGEVEKSRRASSQSQQSERNNEQALKEQIIVLEEKNKKILEESQMVSLRIKNKEEMGQQEISTLKEEISRLKEELRRIKEEMQGKEKELEEKGKEIFGLKERQSQGSNGDNMSSSNAVSRAFDEERASYQGRVQELREKVAELTKENERIDGLEKNLVELQEIVDQQAEKGKQEIEEVKRASRNRDSMNESQGNKRVDERRMSNQPEGQNKGQDARVNDENKVVLKGDRDQQSLRTGSEDIRRHSDEIPIYPQHLKNKPIGFNSNTTTINNNFFHSNNSGNPQNIIVNTSSNHQNYALTAKNFYQTTNSFSNGNLLINSKTTNEAYPSFDVERGRQQLPRSYAQVKSALAATIKQSKQLDEELGQYKQRKQHSASSQGFRGNARSSSRESQHVYNDKEGEYSNEQDKRITDRQSMNQQLENSSHSSMPIAPMNKYREEVLRRLYNPKEEIVFTQAISSNGLNKITNSPTPLRLSQLPMAKSASTSFFPRNKDVFAVSASSFNAVQIKSQIQNNIIHSKATPNLFESSPANTNNNNLLLIPSDDSYEDDFEEQRLHEEIKNRFNAEKEQQFLQTMNKSKADLIFPFKSPKSYYQNKAQLHAPKGRLIIKDPLLFSYIPSDQQLNRFKRACLKWKFPVFVTNDIQIGQISSFEISNNQYILKLGLYVANKTTQDMTALSLEHLHANSKDNCLEDSQVNFCFFWHKKDVDIQEDIHIDSVDLFRNRQIKQELMITYTQIPFQVPITEMEYRTGNFTRRMQLAIPCLLTKFTEFQQLQSILEFKRLWKTLSLSAVLRSDSMSLNEQIARTPSDFQACFPSFMCINEQKAAEFKLGMNDYVLGGEIFIRQSKTLVLLKINLKPGDKVSFKVGALGEMDDSENRRIAEFYLQTLLFLFTQ